MQSNVRTIRFKRLAIQWELRRVPPASPEKEADKGPITLTYTLLLEDPLYAETVMSQRRFTLNIAELPHEIRDAFVKKIQSLESIFNKVGQEKSLFLTSVTYIPAGIDEADSGNFSIKSREGITYEKSTVRSSDAEKIRSDLSQFDSFFYNYVLDRVRDENSRLGTKLEGL